MTWDEAVRIALALPDAALSTSYGKPAVKANGRTFLSTNPEAASFVLHLDHDTIALMREIHPDTFWKTPHYEGYAAVLVRFDGDDILAREMIERAHEQASAKRPPRPRSRSRRVKREFS